MKYSIFNSEISLSDGVSLLYNSLHDKFLVMRKGVYDEADVDVTNGHYRNNLIAGHFLIDDNIDEIAQLKELQKQVDLSTDMFQLIVNPTVDCNFSCWYCYETHDKNTLMNDDTLENVRCFIRNTLTRVNYFNLSFFGGEPLLGFEKVVKPLLEFSAEKVKEINKELSVSFTSNGFLLNKDRIKYLSQYEHCSFQITLDGGRDEHNKTRFPSKGKDSYDRIIENVKELLKNKISVMLRINCTKKNLHSLQEVPDSFKDVPAEYLKNLKVDFHQVWQDKCDIAEEMDEVISTFEKAELCTSRSLFDNVRNSCYGDKKNSTLINYDGNVFKCTAVDFSKTQRDGFLSDNGEIVWENDSLEKRLNSKFKNKPCLSCRILPICNGGCAQKALEYSEIEYCILDFDEKKKHKAILDKFRHNILYNPSWEEIITKT